MSGGSPLPSPRVFLLGETSHQPDNILAGTQIVSLIEVRGARAFEVVPECNAMNLPVELAHPAYL